MANFFKKVMRVAAPIAGAVFGGPIGASIGGAIGAKISGHDPLKGALLGGLAAPALVAGGGALLSGGGFSGAGSAAMTALRTTGGSLLSAGRTLATGGMFGPPVAGEPPPSMFSGRFVPMSGDQIVGRSNAAPGTGIVLAAGAGGEAMPVMSSLPSLAGQGIRMVGNLLVSGAGKIRGIFSPVFNAVVGAKKAMKMVRTIGLAATATGLGVLGVEVASLVAQEATRRPFRSRGISARQLRTATHVIGRVERMHDRIVHAARAAGACPPRRRRAA